MPEEVFELELMGGGMERRYRRMRPEVEQMPWATLDPSLYPEASVLAALQAWTAAAFQEHRTAAACAATLRALVAVRAPLDLLALAARFPLDELVHVELCARMAMQLGGATELIHDPDDLWFDPDRSLSPMVRAGDLVVRYFCVSEAISIPVLRETCRAAVHPLSKAVLARIVRDEAAHGAFGWMFLDWALPHIDQAGIAVLTAAAEDALRQLRRTWDEIRRRPPVIASEVNALGWLETAEYLTLVDRSLESNVLAPLRRRGIVPRP